MSLLRPSRSLPIALASALALAGALSPAAPRPPAGERHFLYVASPGVRNYVEYGGVGVLVFDMDAGYRFVKRIPTFAVPPGLAAENVKGVAASAASGRLYVTTPKRLAAIDLVTGKMLWNREYELGCDRMAISPDGRLLYVPSFEGPSWRVVDGATAALALPGPPSVIAPAGRFPVASSTCWTHPSRCPTRPCRRCGRRPGAGWRSSTCRSATARTSR